MPTDTDSILLNHWINGRVVAAHSKGMKEFEVNDGVNSNFISFIFFVSCLMLNWRSSKLNLYIWLNDNHELIIK